MMSQKTSDVKGSVPPEHWFPQTLWSDPPGTQTPANALHALHPQDNNAPSDSTSTGNLRATARLVGEVFIDTIFDMRDHLLLLKPPGVYPGGGELGTQPEIIQV